MPQILAPLIFAALIWWASTGILLWLVRRGSLAHKTTISVLAACAILATIGALVLRGDTSVTAAFLGFAGGITIWAAHEAAFLFGFVTGSRKSPCPPDLPMRKRFVVSAQAVIHHELALAGHGLILIALSYGAPNQIMASTFALLWVMRLSTKLIIFLGAPNISVDMLPRQLSYLGTYFNKRHITLWFPVILTVITAIAGYLAYAGLAQPAGGFAYSGYLLLATLACLAVFEHMALVVPMPDRRLWAWALNDSTEKTTAPSVKQRQIMGGPDGL